MTLAQGLADGPMAGGDARLEPLRDLRDTAVHSILSHEWDRLRGS